MTTSPDAHAWARRAGGGDGPPEVHEAVLETPDGRRMTLVAASETAIIATAARIDSVRHHPSRDAPDTSNNCVPSTRPSAGYPEPEFGLDLSGLDATPKTSPELHIYHSTTR